MAKKSGWELEEEADAARRAENERKLAAAAAERRGRAGAVGAILGSTARQVYEAHQRYTNQG